MTQAVLAATLAFVVARLPETRGCTVDEIQGQMARRALKVDLPPRPRRSPRSRGYDPLSPVLSPGAPPAAAAAFSPAFPPRGASPASEAVFSPLAS